MAMCKTHPAVVAVLWTAVANKKPQSKQLHGLAIPRKVPAYIYRVLHNGLTANRIPAREPYTLSVPSIVESGKRVNWHTTPSPTTLRI